MRNGKIRFAAVAVFAVLALTEAASAYYSPRLGRFLNRDPMDEPGHVLVKAQRQPTVFISRDPMENNSYRSFRNNAISWFDPDGEQAASQPTPPGSQPTPSPPVTISIDSSCKGWNLPSSDLLRKACSWVDQLPKSLVSDSERACLKRRCYDNDRQGKIVCLSPLECKCICRGGPDTTYGCGVPYRRAIWMCRDEDECEDIDTIFHEFGHSCRINHPRNYELGKEFKSRCIALRAPAPARL